MISNTLPSQDLPSVQHRARRTFGWLVLASLGLSVFLAAAYPVLHWILCQGCERDRLRDWKAHYHSRIASSFVLPAELQVLSAKERHTQSSEEDELRFRLPATRSPETWLQQIARDSRLSSARRASRFEYHGLYPASFGGPLRLAYDPRDNSYTVRVTRSGD